MRLKYYFDKIFNTVHLINEIDNLTQRLDFQIERTKQLQNKVDALSERLRNFYPIVSVTKNICNPFIADENEQYIITVADLHESFKISSLAPQDIKADCFKQALRVLGGAYLERSLELTERILELTERIK